MDGRHFPKQARIFEVGPRDGLQNEPHFIATEHKVSLTNLLVEAGCQQIEVTSFVHPKWVPQMADAEEVLARIPRRPGVLYNALIPNVKGLDRAVAAGLTQVVTIMSASESQTYQEPEHERLGVARGGGGHQSRGAGVACGCGPTSRRRLGARSRGMSPRSGGRHRRRARGIRRVRDPLGDTTGMASPGSAYEVGRLVKSRLQRASLAVHFHQADGIEFANVLASLEAGIEVFDGAAGGLGGCPYAPGASGNIATETLVEMLHRMGIETGIDRQKLAAAAAYAKGLSAYAATKEN